MCVASRLLVLASKLRVNEISEWLGVNVTATASVCNVILMRNGELSTGIEVFDSQERVIGTSRAAARKVTLLYFTYGLVIIIIMGLKSVSDPTKRS